MNVMHATADGNPPRLALFDLDNTLLTGDSDILWCAYLMECGMLGAEFGEANAVMDRRYRAGEATAAEFCAFYASTLTGITRQEGQRLRERFLHDWIRPRIPQAARALVEHHRQAAELLVMTTATNRFITELTAHEFGIQHLIATELEEHDGVFTGRTRDVLNMREGKVTRLQAWLAARGWPLSVLAAATCYSDSINDLPLLCAVGVPVAVDPDRKLRAEAEARKWEIRHLGRTYLR